MNRDDFREHYSKQRPPRERPGPNEAPDEV